MRLSNFPTAPGALTFYLGTFGLLSESVLARPSPEPKASWVRKGHGRKALSDVLKGKRDNLRRSVQSPSNETGSCAGSLAAPISAPKVNVWAELEDTDAAAVVAWLFNQPEFNLTTAENATEWDNTVILVEAIQPNKTEALSYIDGDASPPAKWAKAILNMRAFEDPYYQEIMIGPLPINNSTTTWSPLTYPLTKSNGGKVRNLDADSEKLFTEWILPITTSIADITLDLWNGTVLGLDNDTLDVFGIDPLWQDDGRIVRWDTFWNIPQDDFDAETLLPLGLFFKSDVTGRDPSQWNLEGWLYNGIFYETTEDFRTAYWSEGFEKNGANVEGDWARTDQQGPVMPKDTLFPPTMVAPAGTRFSVDAEQKYVEWMDFSFYIGFSRDTGISLHDIRYKGERLIYELALQEALAHYAGNDPVQSGTSYLDTFYGFGPYAFQLVPGYDCPTYATYLNSSFYVSETTHTHINSICLFEYGQYHFSPFTDPRLSCFGIHSQDILGTENSVQLMTQKPVTTTYPWSGNKTRNTMKLERSFIETEDDGSLNWDFNAQTQVIVVNQNETNKYGEYRGYRILPYTGLAHLTVQNSSNLANAARWAEHDLYVTKRKDTEPKSAHAYNSQDVHDPPVNFEAFLDGESLQQEDLVVWFNLGMHHVPHTGDLPNTVFTTAHSGMQFMPSNYFTGDQSRNTVNMVRIDYKDGNTSAVELFGQKSAPGTCKVDYAPGEADLWGYTGDVVVRKFPYDPNNPYFETDSIV
ncbi:hypothetical protein KVR01_013339 [Diaporthe batatas]|uniref:uncharacterized protein n=1 Tax=Diaporthe batatas TaxID=748121 RepID=UPI001D04F44B|nr:uncharacterized protein KVR01_013339 [Diaporthe batatas]KAG8156734.1 hypothetical protein KVR01_013339 [Diaporthe batatas]